MKTIHAAMTALSFGASLCLSGVSAADAPVKKAMAAEHGSGSHRYMVERTFPSGALAGLDAATKEKVNANNAKFGVKWEMSYANADKTKTYCVYDGPSEAAVRDAAKANGIPVDSVMEVPVTLEPSGPVDTAK